jgi:hypothetical protein
MGFSMPVGSKTPEVIYMGRPIVRQTYLGANAPHQIQATAWGSSDTGATAGYLTKQNSPRRFRVKTVNGTSLTNFVNGPGNIVSGTSYVNVFPVGTQPTTYATANATLKTLGNANVTFGGQNYKAGDFLTLVGGIFTNAANVQVLTVTGNANSISSLSTPVAGVQNYTTLPANVAAIATTTSGNGSGALVSFNFGVATANILTAGAGYTTAVLVVGGETTSPVFIQPAVVGGAVTLGPVTIQNPGIVNVNPVATVEEETGNVEYLSYLQSMNFLNTYQGHRYRWLDKGQPIPADYAGLNVKLAYLDTL